MNYSWEIARIIFYLLLVLGLIYLFGYFLKTRLIGQKQGQYINILERSYLSSKTSLALARVNDRVLLIGITDNKLELLYEWELEDFNQISGEEGKNFRDYIQSFIKKDYYQDSSRQSNDDEMNRRDNNGV
jgi:flagellar biogenesis protein FliO